MLRLVLVGAAVVVALGALFLGTNLMDSGKANADAAVIINDFACGIPDGDGNFVITDASHSVQTQSHNGNTVLKCSAKGVPNSTGKAVQWDYDSLGIPCGTLSGITNDWHATVSASGNATLTCTLPE
jgi:hypothetical protein